jgi:Asp-tRNA(Asn)/Glu-tRNA(Gln) amidotransferase B subunit
VNEYKKGKTRVMKHFVGHVMKHTRGRANGPLVTQLLEQLLREQSSVQTSPDAHK